MATGYDAQVDELWKYIYNLLRGPGRLIRLPSVMNITLTSAATLPDKFDDDLLNKVSKLKNTTEADRPAVIADVRGNIHVCEATSVIGHEDAEKVQTMLDALE